MSDIILPDIFYEINEEYKKMRVQRRVAEKHPTGIIYDVLKSLDEAWEEIIMSTNENN